MSAAWQVAALAGFSGVLMAAGIGIVFQRKRQSPEKRERMRRLKINERGRLADGTVTDVSSTEIHYSYSVAGVEYRTGQDVSALSQLLPPDPDRLIGPVTLKYLPRNPANSIILCEWWSGLRNPAKEKITNEA